MPPGHCCPCAGRPYSIWKVTDLDQTSHSLFLFGAAHGDLWKENVGTIVALFSPKVGGWRSETGAARAGIQIPESGGGGGGGTVFGCWPLKEQGMHSTSHRSSL